MPRKTWQPLQAGDKAVLLTPSLSYQHRYDEARLSSLKKNLKDSLSLDLTTPPDFLAERYHNWVNTPERRAEQIIEALQDPKNKLLLIHNGGNFCEDVIEILRRRKDEIPIRNDMVALGFSDGDQLLLFLGGELGVITPVEGTLGPTNFDVIHDLLFNQNVANSALTPLNEAAQKPVCIEGKLEIYNPDDRRSSYRALASEEYGSILLLEAGQGGRNSGGGLDFSLRKMREQNERPRAIVLSEIDRQNFSEISAVATSYDIPIFVGATFGHGAQFKSSLFPLHTDVKIENGELKFISAVRSEDNVEEVRKVYSERQKYKSPQPANIERTTSTQSNVERFTNPITDFLISRPRRFYKKHEALNVDGLDLEGRNLLLNINILPPYEQWRTNDGSEKTRTKYDETFSPILAQVSGEVLMELKKTGALDDLRSVVFASSVDLPREFSDWLEDFSARHCPTTTLLSAKIDLEQYCGRFDQDSLKAARLSVKTEKQKNDSQQQF